MLQDFAEILTLTNRELFFKTEDEYREITGTRHQDMGNNFILEPFGRNTAPAIAAAALQVAASYEKHAGLVVLIIVVFASGFESVKHHLVCVSW